ncbi:MAG: gamma-glutamylcyclotransferase family protein [Gemmatimonadota bacterium]
MRDVHIFVYGTLRDGEHAGRLLHDCERLGAAQVTGMLFDAGAFPAMILAGRGRVHGELWRCPPDAVARLDDYEGTDVGLFRRVGLRVDGVPCWTYVAGPALASRLTPDRRIESGAWPPDAKGRR